MLKSGRPGQTRRRATPSVPLPNTTPRGAQGEQGDVGKPQAPLGDPRSKQTFMKNGADRE